MHLACLTFALALATSVGNAIGGMSYALDGGKWKQHFLKPTPTLQCKPLDLFVGVYYLEYDSDTLKIFS